MTNHCGNCTACCRVFEIPAIKKPAGTWCQHCAIGEGCTIYDVRPQMCAEFKCLWLLSQEREDHHERLPPELRPDKCKVVFSPTTSDDVMAATIMPGHAHEALDRKGVRKLIEALISNGAAVVVGTPRSTERVLLDRNGAHPVTLTEPDENGMQFNIPKEQTK